MSTTYTARPSVTTTYTGRPSISGFQSYTWATAPDIWSAVSATMGDMETKKLIEEARKYKISNNESYLTVEGNNVILNSKGGVKSVYNKFDNPEEANIGANLASKRLSGEDIPTFKKEFAGTNESGFNNIKSAEIELAKIKSRYKDYDFEIKPKRMGTINKSATDRYVIIAKLNKEALKKYGIY